MSRMSTLYTICTDENIYVRNRARHGSRYAHAYMGCHNPPIKKKRKKAKSQLKSFVIFITQQGEKRTHLVESSGSDYKKLVSNSAPKSTKKSQKFTVKSFVMKINGNVKMNKLLVCCR